MSSCFCGSEKSYDQCCGLLHTGGETAQTAEQLMRSRYSAFVLHKADYLKQTWCSETCPSEISFDPQMKWMRLEIINATESQVEFKASFIENGKLYCLHENSDFVQADGRWFYHSGQLFDEPVSEVGRNQACPCASGKKFKHCCFISG